MTPLIRMPHRIITGALLAVVAACVNTQPLTAQSASPPTARDSVHARKAKAAADTVAAALTKYCKTKGAASYVCSAQAVLVRTQAAESSLVAFAPAPAPIPIPAPTDTAKPVPVDSAAPTLPVFLNTDLSNTPSTGRRITVIDLQPALDTARAGDQLTLNCMARFVGNFSIRPRPGGIAGQWITLLGGCPLPAEGVRVSHSTQLPKIVSPNALAALTVYGPASKWRLTGIDVSVDSSVTDNNGIVLTGTGDQSENTVAMLSSDIIYDRMYIHGVPGQNNRRCLTLNGLRLAVINSILDECHAGAYDVQAVAVWKGSSIKITNNYLAASTEVIALGGSDPVIPEFHVGDIEIRHNHITRPMAWLNGPWNIKNLIEIKNGNRVLIDGNVLENSWPNGQQGEAFVFWSVNAQLTAPQSETANLTVTNNLIRNVGRGFNLAAQGYWTTKQVPMHDVLIRNNVIIGLTASGGDGRIYQISDTIANLRIEHNTAFSPSNSSFIWAPPFPLHNHVVRNNLAGGGMYQLFASAGVGDIAWAAAADSGNSAFVNNVIVGYPGSYHAIPNNWYPGAFDDVGLVGGGTTATSVNATLDQMVLVSTSPYKGKATDGKDVGADIATLKAAIAGVVQPIASTQRLRIRKP